jgi:hypothetical protein
MQTTAFHPAIIETAFEDGTPSGLPMEKSHTLSREWVESSWNQAGAA